VLLFLLLICVPSIALVILGDDLHASTAGLGPSIYSVGLPEELTKAIPVLAVALIYRLAGRHELMPRDYLFLGAVSGLVFGASEVVHYFTVKRLEPGQRPSAVDRGHHDQRHPVPGLRESRIPHRPGGSRGRAARRRQTWPAIRASGRHPGRDVRRHPALVGALTVDAWLTCSSVSGSTCRPLSLAMFVPAKNLASSRSPVTRI